MKIFENTEELEACVGRELGVSEWLEISQERIDAFAEVTNDRQWIHVDPERTQRELGRGTISHGFLTLSLVSYFTGEICKVRSAGHLLNYGVNKVRFTNMVPSGSRIRARVTLAKIQRNQGMLYLVYAVVVEIEGEEKPAMFAEAVMILSEKNKAAARSKRETPIDARQETAVAATPD